MSNSPREIIYHPTCPTQFLISIKGFRRVSGVSGGV